MAADVGGDGGRVGVVWGQAGDTEYRDRAQWGAVEGVAVALEQEDLFDVREQAADVVGRGQDFDRADIDAVVAAVGGGVVDGDLLPREGVQGGEEPTLVLTHTEYIVGAALVQVGGVAALGV